SEPEQKTDRDGDEEGEDRPERRAPPEAGVRVAPPECQIRESSHGDRPARRRRHGARARGKSRVPDAHDRRRSRADQKRRDGHRGEEQDGQIEREHQRIADPADESGQPRAQAECRRWAQERSTEKAYPDAGGRGERERTASAARRREHEPRHAFIEIAERPQPLPQLVDRLLSHSAYSACFRGSVPPNRVLLGLHSMRSAYSAAVARGLTSAWPRRTRRAL